MNPRDQVSDDELRKNLAITADGSLAAVAERYLDTLYDFARRTALDAAVAEAAVVAALERAAHEVDPAQRLSLKAWLLGITRDEAVERSRTRGGRIGDDADLLAAEDPSFSLLPDLDPNAGDAEIAAWAWQASRAQRPRDYSLLDMSVRRDLTPDEIADATSMSPSGIFAVLGRLRGLLEETFTATVLYHRGEDACADLAAMIESQPALTTAARRDVVRHAESCVSCRATRRRYGSPSDLLAAFTILPAGEETRRRAFDLEEGGEAATGLAVQQPGVRLPVAESSVETDDAEEDAAPAADDADDNDSSPAVDAAGVALASEAVLLIGDDADLPQGAAAETSAQPPGEQAPPDEDETPAFTATALEIEGEPDVKPAVGEPVADHGRGQEDGSAPEGELVARAPRSAAFSGVSFTPPADDGQASERRRMILSRGGSLGGPPPRRPRGGFADWLGQNGPTRIPLLVLLVGATALAAYLGLAIGDSIEGGSNGNAAVGIAALPTRQPGVREIACGTGPIEIDQASPTTLSFDSDGRIIPGFQISEIKVASASLAADAKSISAKAQQGLTMALLAQPLAGAPGRVDEYKVDVSFTRSSEKAVSQCTLRVKAPLVMPTAAATSTPTATASPTPRPAVIQPTTAPPPTNTASPTATPANTSTPSPTPTRSPTPTQTSGPTPAN